MAQSSKVYVYEEQFPEIEVISGDDKSIRIFGEDSLIRLYEPGPQGPKGDQGPAGYSGAGEPFFVIQSGSLFGSTASLALINAFFSSSIIPLSSSFDLGTELLAWRNIFAKNLIQVSHSKITSQSFGFEHAVISRVTENQQTFLIKSSSTSHSINESGIFILADFTFLPNPILGGLIKSGSELFIGV